MTRFCRFSTTNPSKAFTLLLVAEIVGYVLRSSKEIKAQQQSNSGICQPPNFQLKPPGRALIATQGIRRSVAEKFQQRIIPRTNIRQIDCCEPYNVELQRSLLSVLGLLALWECECALEIFPEVSLSFARVFSLHK